MPAMPLDRRTFPAAFARAYQQATGFEKLHPKLD
jgi:hypothetical protein